MLDSTQKSVFRCMCLMSGGFPHINPAQIEGIFVWGRAADEYKKTCLDPGVLLFATDLYRQTKATIFIPGYIGRDHGQTEFGYPGPEIWKVELKALGVPDEKIFPITGDGHNTKTEFEDFLATSNRLGLKTVIGVSQLTHILRAMLGALKSMTTCKSNLKLIPAYAPIFDFTRMCYGSQGIGPLSRTAWINEEFDRIPRYANMGHMATLKELDEYLLKLHEG